MHDSLHYTLPWTRLLRDDIVSAVFIGEDENLTALAARAFFEIMVELNSGDFKDVKLFALGPTTAKISKINNNFRYRIALKCKNNARTREMVSEILKRFSKMKDYKKISIGVDINPNDLS